MPCNVPTWACTAVQTSRTGNRSIAIEIARLLGANNMFDLRFPFVAAAVHKLPVKPAVLRSMRWQLFAQLLSNITGFRYKDQAALRPTTSVFQALLSAECDVPKMTSMDDPPLPSMVAFEIERGLGFKESCETWWDVVSKMSALMGLVDSEKHESDDVQLRAKLILMKKAELMAFVAKSELLGVTVPGNVDMFPSQKDKVVETIVQSIEKKKGPDVVLICNFMRGDLAAKIAGM
jgi:hypothetical protein